MLKRPKEKVNKDQTDCIKYLRQGGNLPEARKLAKLDGKTFSTADWCTAIGKILK